MCVAIWDELSSNDIKILYAYVQVLNGHGEVGLGMSLLLSGYCCHIDCRCDDNSNGVVLKEVMIVEVLTMTVEVVAMTVMVVAMTVEVVAMTVEVVAMTVLVVAMTVEVVAMLVEVEATTVWW